MARHAKTLRLSLTPVLAGGLAVLTIVAMGAMGAMGAPGSRSDEDEASQHAPLQNQTLAQAEAKSAGCLTCHGGIEPMHASPAVKLGCVDCHGGDATVRRPEGAPRSGDGYQEAQERAHPRPTLPQVWQDHQGRPSSANPVRPYTQTLRESAEYVRFVNPGDLRVAYETCGGCHPAQVNAVQKSPMKTSSIFWVAAGYANGIVGRKRAFLGESYGRDGVAQAIVPKRPLTPDERVRGAVESLVPLPRWEVLQPGEYFRAFERGGLQNLGGLGAIPFTPFFPDVGNPNVLEEPGRPDIRLSERGRGTGARISPALINLHKTRLNDPHLSFFGTNDHPGDYRSSGCSACHVVYANDRDPLHSGPWARFGHLGQSQTSDPTICGPRDGDGPCANTDSGHPVRHRLTRAIPSSQCMSCHMHQPNAFLNTYLGYTMWDYETDGEFLWPKEQRYPTEAERRSSLDHNPEGAAPRGLWTDPDFLARVRDLNPELRHTQFADYHGHGWVFRAVYKRDRRGNLLDADGDVVAFDAPDKFQRAVHLRDIHAERGMHCVDCHFSRDAHGDGLLHGEYGNAIEIECRDCHGDLHAYTDLRTTGPMAPAGGSRMELGTTPFGRRRFDWAPDTEGAPGAPGGGQKLLQRSMLDPDLEWEVKQVRDTVTPGHRHYNEKASYAKTLRPDGTWGDPDLNPLLAAHKSADMACNACHSSWITSCSGCHLPQESNHKSPMYHYEGLELKQYASYNPQVIRTDAYMLGLSGTVKGNRLMPVRSSSALVLSSTNINRKTFYHQQPPISAPGFSSQAFNPHVPHTVRTRETKACDDCHLSYANDNNAWMANLLIHGTNFPNFMGRNVWVAQGKKGFQAVEVTEWDEPQAVIGSTLHRIVYPDFYEEHQKGGKKLHHAHHHSGSGGEVRSLQLRGEFLFAAKGPGGFQVFDVANVANRDFSEAVVTQPVSPLGQRTYLKTRYATAVALPTTMPVAPWRRNVPENQEQPWHPIYHYAFISDREEGLILVNVDTLTDAEPRNNFFKRALTWNPEGRLAGSENLTVAGNYVYLVGSYGLILVDCGTPLEPKIAAHLPASEIGQGTAVAVQFRYAFVTHGKGLSVVDVTDPARPRVAAELADLGPVHNVYVARTYAYLAAGTRGMVIVDVERPEAPRVVVEWDGEGKLTDTRDVKVASTNSSLFAYIADYENGLAVAQLTSPDWTPTYLGFSPRPEPRLIATYPHAPALALSKGLDRDRAVDESGNQVSVFNRIGARPLNLEEQRRLYLRDGKPYFVTNHPVAEKRQRSTAPGSSQP